MEWYKKTIVSLFKEFDTDSDHGLTHEQVRTRFKTYGYNTLPDAPAPSWGIVFIRQFQSPLIYVLLIAALIIFFVGPDKKDAFIISGVLFFNAIIGTIQEGRTRSILQQLQHFIKTDSLVIRDGQQEVVEDTFLVPGDIIILQAGQKVPADARLLQANSLHVDEAMLTGESSGVEKLVKTLDQNRSVADQSNMVFRGTHILSGSAHALVVATGINTQVGKIHQVMGDIETDMPLKKEIERLSYWILFFILFMCILLFFIGVMNGKPMQELLVMLTALFICVIPEGLPVVLTLVLVTGVYRMAKKNILVKKMQSVEALGRVKVIVIDKTGTLTRNEMMVSQIYVDNKRLTVSGRGYHREGSIFLKNKKIDRFQEDSPLLLMGIASSLLNNTHIALNEKTGLFSIIGDPTEAALFIFSQKMGLHKSILERDYQHVYEMPFDSATQYHAAFYNKNNQGQVFVIGSPEIIFKMCISVEESAAQELAELLKTGLRVIAIAMKKVDHTFEKNHKDKQEFFKGQLNDCVFLGLCGIQDAIRENMKAIIEQVSQAGIRVVIATGDHKTTARYVAKEVGIMHNEHEVITGQEFDAMDDKQVLAQLDSLCVYARVSPYHKLRIIELFHKKGIMVAMTGDGINDVPSLIAADLGICMGQIGTEVTKQASDIVLLDDSFVNIVQAIEQGRHIFYALKRVILYFFSTNMGEILIVLFALVANLPLPITAAQILWLNLVTDGFLDSALSMEPQEKGLLSRSWLENDIHLVDRDLVARMMFMAIPMGVGSLWVFLHYYQHDITLARTMVLLTMAMFQWFNAWNCRSTTHSVFSIGLFTNKWFIGSAVLVFFLQLLLLYAPFMQSLFFTVPLSLNQWGLVIALSSSVFFMEEGRKWFVKHIGAR